MLKTGDAVNGTDASGVSQSGDGGTNVIASPGIATTGSIPALAPSSDAGSDYLEQSALIAGGGAATISPSSAPSFIGFGASSDAQTGQGIVLGSNFDDTPAVPFAPTPPALVAIGSGFDAGGFDASGLTAASSAIAGVITLKPDPGPPSTSADNGGATTDIVTTAGSGMVFNNTFESSVSSAYKNAALTAEQTIAGLFTDNITIDEDFKAVASGQNGNLASNNFSILGCSYSQLKSALQRKSNDSSVAMAAFNSLPASDPAGGQTYFLPGAYANFLGLSSGSFTDTVTLNTSFNWSFGQDVVDTLTHEISEGGMGRVGGLGVGLGGRFSTMDLFSFNGSEARDLSTSDNSRFFSFNGGATTSQSAGLSYFAANSGNDAADFQQLDVFGTGGPGETNTISQTDINEMEALGWTPRASAPPVTPITKHTAYDFDGDGKSDILFQNQSNGGVYEWQMDGFSVVATGFAGASTQPADWKIITGGGDFNGDGKSDILFQNQSNGGVYEWQMDGTSIISSGFVGATTQPLDWEAVATGDFNGDGKSDILFQNQSNGGVYEWQMDGTSIISSGFVGATTQPLDWKVVATGDFNGDGKSDILFQNQSNGGVYEWQMDGTSIISSGFVGATTEPLDWKVVTTGDFNGDGKSDILWQNQLSGAAYIWEMDGTSIIGSGFAGATTEPLDWKVKGTGDFNGDGKSDILWQNQLSGAAYIWEMNGTSIIGSGFAGATTQDTNWQIIAHI